MQLIAITLFSYKDHNQYKCLTQFSIERVHIKAQ